MTNPAPYPFQYSANPYWRPSVTDPDNPGWGPGGGVSLWFVSVALLMATQIGAVLVRMIELQVLNGSRPPKFDPMQDSRLVLYTVLSTAVAHALTVLVCWMFVQKFSRTGFLPTLGWGWTNGFRWYHGLGLVVVFLFMGVGLEKLIPGRTTDFDKMLEKGQAVRVSIACMAVFTAPFVEEVIYRGVLFAGLRSRFNQWITIGIVSFLFLLVHVPQYWGGWAGLILLGTLSLALTVIRAETKSILPGVYIHTLFNAAGALSILLAGQQK